MIHRWKSSSRLAISVTMYISHKGGAQRLLIHGFQCQGMLTETTCRTCQPLTAEVKQVVVLALATVREVAHSKEHEAQEGVKLVEGVG